MTLPRFIIRWGLISVLALGGATLLIGPERVAAGLSCIRTKAQSVVDRAVDSPTALRRQLVELAEEYPHRIARVQSEIAEVDYQIGQFEHDSEVSARVVAMTGDDLDQLKTLIARANNVDGRPVYVRFEGVRFDVDGAKAEANRISNVRTTYGDRVHANQQQLVMLGQQKSRLTEILSRLEDEFSTFETQMWQLDRQIDAIERNDRLIEMTQQLQATLDGYDKWGRLDNLKQLQAQLAHLKMIQDAQLEQLRKIGIHTNYEDRARFELDSENASTNEETFEQLDETDDAEETDADSFAWAPPVVIE